MIGKSMSLQKSSKSQQNVCVVRPWECFSLNLQNFVHLISALSSFLSVEEDRKKRYNFESQDTTSYPSILGWRRISIAGSVPCWPSCHMPLGYIWKKPLYPRAFTTGDTCLVVTLKFYMSRYIASSLLNQTYKNPFLNTCWDQTQWWAIGQIEMKIILASKNQILWNDMKNTPWEMPGNSWSRKTWEAPRCRFLEKVTPG